jgi:hypothetical protein
MTSEKRDDELGRCDLRTARGRELLGRLVDLHGPRGPYRGGLCETVDEWQARLDRHAAECLAPRSMNEGAQYAEAARLSEPVSTLQDLPPAQLELQRIDETLDSTEAHISQLEGKLSGVLRPAQPFEMAKVEGDRQPRSVMAENLERQWMRAALLNQRIAHLIDRVEV